MNPLEALKKYFGYQDFRPAQLEIIEEILNGKNILSILPTGAGKSICYQIPALISDNYSIVISPLIALMKDQVDSLNKTSEVAAFINSTQSFIETEKVLQDIAYGKIKLVYVAPERLENTEFALRLKNLNPQFLFIDEAHCISEWGHNFRPSYAKLKDFIEFIGLKNISAFTATATPEVVKDIIKQLGLKNVKLIVKGFERDNLFVNAEITKKKKERCVELIHQHKSPAIIYTSSRKKTEELAEFLQLNKINCQYYHAGLDPIIRKKIQEDFIEDRVPIIIATNAFGMGIDKKDIRLVIHFNMPGTIENYYQEIGRAGRDGKNSFAYLLYDESDVQIHNYFISNSYPTKELIKNIYDAICESAQIAVGNQPEKEILINLKYIKLYLKQDISPALLYSSLKYLETAGYLRVNSAYKSSDKIKIIFEQDRLKRFIKKTSNELMKDTLLYLIKTSGNQIFVKQTGVNFAELQRETGLTNQEVDDTLSALEYLGIIEFNKADGKETISLTNPRVKAEELRLNYKLINEFYISSKQKLDKMVDYVYTRECRFKFILKYFGEDAENYSCGKCDYCLRERGTSDISYNYIKENLLDLLSEVKDSLSEKDIINISLGKEVNQEFRLLKCYASLKAYNQNDIIKALRILENETLVEPVKIGQKKLFKIPTVSLPQKDIFITDIKRDVDYDANLELFHLLRDVREQAAKKFLQSPNIICPDSLLSKISQEKPKTKYELLGIKGFNERMFNKIGNDFLEVINSYTESATVPKAKPEKKIPTNILETYNLLKKKYSLSEISKLRKLTEAVISMQIETIIDYVPEIDITGIIDYEKFILIKNEYEKGFDSLKNFKERLPKEFSYPLIRIALAKLKVRPS